MFRPSTSLGEVYVQPRYAEAHPSLQSRLKRLTDIVVSGMFLLAFFWLYAAVALLVAITTGAPVIYRHQRIGADGVPFGVFKFRSMVVNADAILAEYLRDNPQARAEWARDFKLRDDPRVTPFGRFIRRTSLDELPQLWNVFKGDMTLVGPRPVTAAELANFYGAREVEYMRVKPGLTGLWQVSGRSLLSYADRIEMDLRYVKEWSFALDMKILWKTPWVVISGRGSH